MLSSVSALSECSQDTLWSRASSPNGSSETSLELRSLRKWNELWARLSWSPKRPNSTCQKKSPEPEPSGPSRDCAQKEKKKTLTMMNIYESNNAKAEKEFLLTFKFWSSCDEVQKVLNYPSSSKWSNKIYLEFHSKKISCCTRAFQLKLSAARGFVQTWWKF